MDYAKFPVNIFCFYLQGASINKLTCSVGKVGVDFLFTS